MISPIQARHATTLLAGAAAIAFASSASAQLTPDRTYYGMDRAIAMTVKVPAGAAGDLTIKLFAPGATEPAASAPVVAGGVDLAGLFPVLWKPDADSRPGLYYAQLAAGDKKIGSPVVLQPLLEPDYAVGNDPSKKPVMRPASGPHTGLRAYTDKHAVLETAEGTIEIQLRPDQAPNTAWNFRELVGGGFYDGIVFHRVVPGFVLQAGDPTGTGEGGPGFTIDFEQSDLPHAYGVLSMARAEDPNSAGSQFFICLGLNQQAATYLNERYTAFGQVVSGVDAIEKIAHTELTPTEAPGQRSERPKEPPVIKRGYLVDAPPFGDAPAPVTAPPAPEIKR